MAKTQSQKQAKKQQGANKPREPSKQLANVPEEFSFWAHDGGIYRNIQELRNALNTMAQETYVYHVNPEKNDFAKWVRDIIQDEALAEALLGCQTPADAAKKVAARIAILNQD